MKIGTEDKKKFYALLGLGAFASYMVYSNLLSGPSTPTPVTPRPSDTAVVRPDAVVPDISRSTSNATTRPTSKGKNGEFRPILRSKKKEDRPVNPVDVDPTIRFDLLAKVNAVPAAGGLRDLFQIAKGPPVSAVVLKKADEPKVFAMVGPRQPPPPPPTQPTPGPPPPEPITLKYYGYTMQRPDGKRTAYFLDGEDILQAIEGDTLKGRYLIVQVGLDKVLVEDKVQKRRQSVNIEPEANSG